LEEAPRFVPTTTTFTPIRGSPVNESKIFPLIVPYPAAKSDWHKNTDIANRNEKYFARKETVRIIISILPIKSDSRLLYFHHSNLNALCRSSK
jgi:hypothetical protein